MTEPVFYCTQEHALPVPLVKDPDPQFSGLLCPEHGVGKLFPYRYCTRCGAKDASWMSGKCDGCYRLITHQLHMEVKARETAQIWNAALTEAKRALLKMGYFMDEKPDFAACPSGEALDRTNAIAAIDALRKETS